MAKKETFDLEKCTIVFPQIGTGSIRRIIIDGVEWGTVSGMPEGRHGVKFAFKDVTGKTVKYAAPSHRKMAPARYYQARAKNKAEIDEVLQRAVLDMIAADDLKHPQQARAIAEEAAAKRQRIIDEANAEKRKLWEEQARKAIEKMTGYVPTGIGPAKEPHPEDIDAVIEAMEWAQAQ